MTSLYDIPLTTLTGEPASLRDFEGQVVMVVNVASKCGLTPQYAALEELYSTYGDRGFTVLGFPCNQFLFQEPGGAESTTACSLSYGVTFPIMEKLAVRGRHQHPLYAQLVKHPTADGKAGKVRWNFEKFLVGRDGQVVGRFTPKTLPLAPEVVAAVEEALATSA